MNPTEESNFKICTQCNKKVISFPNNFCRKQFLSSIDNETSGNINLDEFIKKTQLNSKFCDDFLEWIPYSNFENIKYLTSGGNSKIYFGNWLLNKSLASMSSLNVVLKVIRISDSLKELKIHHKCRGQNIIPFYGITKAPEEDEYAMVIQCAKYGDLRNYIRKFFSSLNWTDKANILIKVSKALNFLHQMNLFHKDIHCKNILVDEEHRILINDFGLCQSSDSEIELALAILDGMRPDIVEGTPEFYVDIMKQCWDPDPSQRPDATLLPKIFEEMMESCKMFDNNIYSPIRKYQSDIINNSNENSAESVGYITQAYNYSLGKLSLSTELQEYDQPEIEEKKITKEFSIELTNQIEYYESKPINSSFDINTITIEEKIIKQCDDNKLRKPRSKKNPEYNENRAYKLRKYQIAGKLKKKNRRSITLPEDDDEIVSGSEDSRYATQTYDFTLDDLNKSYNRLQ
ncbi:kinase-like domain-containing protein [Rhizophagus diaphanus]|nr:kinase-like domain-containing protein [Rhizophagus diaphanus] [Rhizophagus sp. MUCL 43196]